MAIVREQKLERFVATVETAGVAEGRVVQMTVSRRTRFVDSGALVATAGESLEAVDWVGLVALIHPDDQDALKIALDTAIAARS